MKHPSLPLVLLLILPLSGCVGAQWPKDAYIKNAKSAVKTPWGSSDQSAAIMATGAAARNLTEDEKKEIVKTEVKK